MSDRYKCIEMNSVVTENFARKLVPKRCEEVGGLARWSEVERRVVVNIVGIDAGTGKLICADFQASLNFNCGENFGYCCVDSGEMMKCCRLF